MAEADPACSSWTVVVVRVPCAVCAFSALMVVLALMVVSSDGYDYVIVYF